MRLTGDELTRLHALERRLVAEDPPLARAFGNLHAPATGKLLQQLIVVSTVLSWGLGMLIFGLVTDVMPLVVVGMLATTLKLFGNYLADLDLTHVGPGHYLDHVRGCRGFRKASLFPVLAWRPYNWLGDSK